MTLVAATSDVAKVASANAISMFRVIGQERMMSRLVDRAIPADPCPSAIIGLAHRFPFPTISQNVAECDEEQKCNQRPNDNKYFQASLLKSGSHQNV